MKHLNAQIINQTHQALLKDFAYTNYFTLLHQDSFGKITDESLCFVTKKHRFDSMYFTSKNPNDLEKIFQDFSSKKTICLEIIQKSDLKLEFKPVIENFFHLKTIYEKMLVHTKKLKLKLKIKDILKNIQYARKSDIDFIYKKLYEKFNINFDHLPNKKTLLSYAQNEQILVKKNGDKITAICIYTIDKKTSHFNYLLNINADSFEILELIEQYYAKAIDSQINYIYLWVDILQNNRVKNMHLQYGYQPSGIFNYAFINKSSEISTKE